MGIPIKKCKSCKAPIIWLLSEKSRTPTPIDPDPVDGGNIEVIGGAFARVVPAEERTRPLYVVHHATCPQGEEWRRKHTNGGEHA